MYVSPSLIVLMIHVESIAIGSLSKRVARNCKGSNMKEADMWLRQAKAKLPGIGGVTRQGDTRETPRRSIKQTSHGLIARSICIHGISGFISRESSSLSYLSLLFSCTFVVIARLR